MGRGLILRCKLACRGLLLTSASFEAVVLCGISPPFGRLSPARGNDYPRVTHPCATLPGPKPFLVRLACVRRAANVRSEPGSNSPVESGESPRRRSRIASLTEPGLWLWSWRFDFGRRSAEVAERTSRLRETHSSSSPCTAAAVPWDAYASVRFSFQGPRTPVSV